MWSLIKQHNDYGDKDIMELHKLCNSFMSHLVNMYSLGQMTNYIHILGSQHFPYFAKKYGNLYQFSQQGWEALNHLLKHYYFNTTNHGGRMVTVVKTVMGCSVEPPYREITADH
jgi:hypothetical protein